MDETNSHRALVFAGFTVIFHVAPQTDAVLHNLVTHRTLHLEICKAIFEENVNCQQCLNDNTQSLLEKICSVFVRSRKSYQ